MQKFRELPKMVEAGRWFESGDVPEAPIWTIEGIPTIKNSNGDEIKLTPGDWVIKFPNGTFGVMSDSRFIQAYRKDKTPVIVNLVPKL